MPVCSLKAIKMHFKWQAPAPQPGSCRHGVGMHMRHHCSRPPTQLASHNQKAELQLGWPGADAFYDTTPSCASADRWDVVGLGQAMIDFSAAVDDTVLSKLQEEKGARRIITLDERAHILEALNGESYQVGAGGSLSNTLMALARLGAASESRQGGRQLRVGMAGLVGADPLGSFYSAQMRAAGVEVLATPVPAANTGTVVVLTSPDAQRTMLSYLGDPAAVEIEPHLQAAIASASVLVIEGYLWELPSAAETIHAAMAAAQACGTILAMTAGDAGVVERHHGEIWGAIDAGIDLLFTNAQEAAALVRHLPSTGVAGGSSSCGCGGEAVSAEAAALALGPHCSLVCVTDGSAGSCITALGQLHVVPPHWTPARPVDTCGAGDAYAAGLLYGFLRHLDVATMGRTGARVASAVIARHGAALSDAAAMALVASLPPAAASAMTAAPAAAPAPLEA